VPLGKEKPKESHAKLSLLKLAEGKCPCITKGQGRHLAEAASVCIDERGHPTVSKLEVLGIHPTFFDLRRLAVNDQMSRALADLKEATELGAAALAILLIEELTEFQAVERAVAPNGVDYWLSDKDDPNLLWSARLEVSGTLAGGQTERKKRIKQKLKQTDQSDGRGIPAMVVVVEFGELVAEVVKKP
jgi:hypothetical protein